MGVYIPNVEMPRGCNSCPLVMEIDNTCSLTMGGCTKDERPPHCPLIEIPQEDVEAVLFLARMRKAMREGKNLREFLDGERRADEHID